MIDPSNPFANLVPATTGGTGTTTPTPTAAPSLATTPLAHTVPLADRGAHPVLADYRKADGTMDTAAFNQAMHNWMYVPHSNPATVTGYHGTTTGTGTGTTTGTGGTPAPGGTPTGTGTTPTTTPTTTPVSQPNFTSLIEATPGYKFQVAQGLDALNSNAYARGMGDSGATYKALEGYGQNLADNYYQQYLNNVASVAAGGASATGALAGVSQNYGNNANAINQTAAGVAGNNALYQGQAGAGMWNGIGNSLSQSLGAAQGAGMFNSSTNPSANLGSIYGSYTPPASSTGNMLYTGSGSLGGGYQF